LTFFPRVCRSTSMIWVRSTSSREGNFVALDD
jgi:hypothetical protein